MLAWDPINPDRENRMERDGREEEPPPETMSSIKSLIPGYFGKDAGQLRTHQTPAREEYQRQPHEVRDAEDKDEL